MTGSSRGSQGARWVPAVLLVIAASILLATRAGAAAESVELDAPAALVWSVLTDFQGWPAFMPSLERVDVSAAGEGRVAIRHETEKLGYAVAFTTLTRVDPERMRLEIALDPSAANDLRAMEASWQVTELAGGRVHVEFRSDLESGQPVPRLLEQRMVGRSVADTVAALAGEVERRQGASVAVAAAGR